MREKCYKNVDVSVYGDILKDKFFCEKKNISLKRTNEFMKELHTCSVYIELFHKDVQKEINKINYAQYGFKSQDDCMSSSKPDVFENRHIVTLIPKVFYELEDKIDLLSPITNSDELFLIMIGDTFERIKIKAQNVIHETEAACHIELYAKKNLQVLHRVFYDATNQINEICSQEKNFRFFKVFVLNTFIYNTILYYQKMFSRFYKDCIIDKNNLKFELLNSIKIQPIMEQIAYYSKSKEKKLIESEKVKPIVWNTQVNILATLIYDLLNEKLPDNKKMLEADIKDLSYLINKYVQDKNGNPISRNTVEICLKDYRSDKRAKNNKKIDVKKYQN